ncbi:putative MFS transporter [Talaromyces proteolyticus]|uniref:MFS transporter n=1 Tax=Talaromyces proteolyticus TaxID=1131652 RepID=A0AAD4PYP4_9EURO|nr:putative MFS transporter [Talaromyces proteolyticus]KAH8694271.1 putative MFS transporter [Talaromyces proteolyticus]
MAASVDKTWPEEQFEAAASREAISQHEGTPQVRKILLKLDVQILPILALMFLCSFLDRTNVGNAKIIGLEADTGMNDQQYDVGLAVFYLFYVCSEVPSNLMLKKASPRIWLPLLTVTWGIITMCLGFVRGFGSFVAVRALLGVAEGGLLPGMVLYLSSFYRRSDLAIRIGLFYTAASLSGAFGGLLARGLVEIGPRGGLEGWRWIFIIEGLLTVLCGIIAAIALPNGIATARYLTPEEREIALDRLLLDKPSLGDAVNSENESLKWSEVFRGLTDVSMWLTAVAYFGILAGLYSFGLFLPTIIQGLKIASSANQVQLWSVIPYAVATVSTVLVAFLSDRLKLRGVIMLFTLPIAIVGYAVIANVSNQHVQYGMTFLMATGMYASIPCILVWNSNNSAGHYKRATTSGMQLAIANCGGFVSTFIYPTKDGPRFHKGHTVVLGLLVFSWFMILFNVLWCHRVNKDKANGKYNKYAGYNDDRDPDFVFVL